MIEQQQIWTPRPKGVRRYSPDDMRHAVGGIANAGRRSAARAPSGGAFSPLDIAGCVAWFDMQDAGSFTDNSGFVSVITNKASSVSWTEATNRPAYSATGLNSKPCMDFDGLNDRIISTEAAVFGAVTDAAAYTIFVVAKLDAVDVSTDVFFGIGNSGFNSRSTRYWGQSTAGLGSWTSRTENDASSGINVNSTATADATAHVFCWYSPGTTVSLSIDQGSNDPNGTAQNPGTLTPTRSALGAMPDSVPDGFLDGQIGELILYNSELSGANRTTVADYLKTRWGTP